MATMDAGGSDAGGQVPQQPTPTPSTSPQQNPVNLDPSLQGKLQAIRDSLSKINDESDDFVEKLGEVSAEFSGLEDTVDQLSGKRKKAAASELADIDVILKARLDALSKEDKEQVRMEQEYQRRIALQRSAAQREVARAMGERRPQADIENIEAGYSSRIAGINRPEKESAGMFSQMQTAAASMKDLVTNITKSTPWQQALKLGPAEAQAQAAMYGAGLGGIIGGARLQSAIDKGAGAGNGIMGPVEIQQLVKTLASMSPKLMTENAQSLSTFMGISGKFGMSIDESADMLGDASARIGVSADELSTTELFAADVKTKLGMATKEATEHIVDMYEAARAGGADMRLVATVMDGFNKNINSLGVAMSKAEASRFTQNLAAGLSSMSATNLVGLTSFKNGTGLPSNEEVMNSIKNPAGLLQNLFDKTIKGMPLANQLPGLDKIAAMAGVSFQGNQQRMAALEMLNAGKLAGLDTKGLEKYAVQPEQVAKLQTEGWETLKHMKNPIDRMSQNLENIAKPLSLWLNRQLNTNAAQRAGTVIMGASQAYDIGKSAANAVGAVKQAQGAMSVEGEAAAAAAL